jgi:amidase
MLDYRFARSSDALDKFSAESSLPLCSVCVVPTGLTADAKLDPKPSDFKGLSDIDKRNAELYDPEVYEGAPIAIQMVARRLQEEKVLAMGSVLEAALKKL